MNRKSLLIAPILLALVLGMLATSIAANEELCIHPVEARGFAVVRLSLCCWIAGRATLEIYEFDSADHPDGACTDTVVVWVAKLTVRRLNAYWVIGDVEFDGSKVKVYATGHAWTWNGMKLSGEPPDIEITVWHTGRYWTWASGKGVFFFGKGS